jgi:hypothetical protein
MDYSWKPQGIKIHEQAVVIDPMLAFAKFVMPLLGNVGWIEDSKKLSDTHMSGREWAGLIIHCLSLMKMTGENLRTGKDFVDGDGVLIRGDDGKLEGVYVEQTLVTHRAHKDLFEGVKERLMGKSFKGENYAANRHLIIWCNIDGTMDMPALAKLISTGMFNIVDIIGFNGATREYFSYVFDKEVTHSPIYIASIKEENLLKTASQAEQEAEAAKQ